MTIISKLFSTIFCIVILIHTIYSQSTNELEIRTGVVFFDSKVAAGDIFKSGNGWGSQADVIFLRTFDIKRKIKPTLGIGYTNFLYWNVDFFDVLPQVLEPPYSYDTFGGDFASHYMNFRYGLEIDIYKEKYNFSVMASHYLLLHKDLQGFNQKRNFMNVDFGFKYQINEKYSLTLSTPFTIHPIVQDGIQQILGAGPGPWASLPQYERFVEMNGILIGLRYKFNK